MKIVGVLALQGDFEAHRNAVERAVEIRTAAQLDTVDGLIIPGGESTTLRKLIGVEQLEEPLRRFAASKPAFATCAGAILLARHVTHPEQPSLGLLDIDVERNAYGRQVDSRIAEVETTEGHDGSRVHPRTNYSDPGHWCSGAGDISR